MFHSCCSIFIFDVGTFYLVSEKRIPTGAIPPSPLAELGLCYYVSLCPSARPPTFALAELAIWSLGFPQQVPAPCTRPVGLVLTVIL